MKKRMGTMKTKGRVGLDGNKKEEYWGEKNGFVVGWEEKGRKKKGRWVRG
jgi:hypothetical protein